MLDDESKPRGSKHVGAISDKMLTWYLFIFLKKSDNNERLKFHFSKRKCPKLAIGKDFVNPIIKLLTHINGEYLSPIKDSKKAMYIEISVLGHLFKSICFHNTRSDEIMFS